MADEIQYHKSCYRNATRGKTLRCLKNVNEEVGRTDKAAHTKALDATCGMVDELIVHGGQVLRLTQLCDVYVEQLSDLGVDMETYRADHLKCKLQQRFGYPLQFVTHAKKKSTLVLALSKEELIGALVDSFYASEEATAPTPTCSKTMEIFYAATIIRQKLMGVKNNMSLASNYATVQQ